MSIDDDLRTPWRDHQDREERRFSQGFHQRDERLEEAEYLGNEIAALREQRDFVASGGFLRELDDRILMLEGRYLDVDSWVPDPRLSSSMGVDERESWGDAS